MTTEYAIALFNSEIKNFKKLDYSPKEAVQEYIDAMEMAIKALKQEPCSDIISRQAAIDLVSTMYLGNDSNSSYRADGDTGDTLVGKFQVIDGLSDLPAVTRSTGIWMVRGQEVYCSKCGGQSAYNCWGASKFSDYCPNCGAKMESIDDVVITNM